MSLILQSVIRAERKNGIIRQKGVANSNLTLEVQDFSADSTIKVDTEGVVVFFSNGEKKDAIFIPLSQQKSLIEAINILKGMSVVLKPNIAVVPIPPAVVGVPTTVNNAVNIAINNDNNKAIALVLNNTVSKAITLLEQVV